MACGGVTLEFRRGAATQCVTKSNQIKSTAHASLQQQNLPFTGKGVFVGADPALPCIGTGHPRSGGGIRVSGAMTLNCSCLDSLGMTRRDRAMVAQIRLLCTEGPPTQICKILSRLQPTQATLAACTGRGPFRLMGALSLSSTSTTFRQTGRGPLGRVELFPTREAHTPNPWSYPFIICLPASLT